MSTHFGYVGGPGPMNGGPNMGQQIGQPMSQQMSQQIGQQMGQQMGPQMPMPPPPPLPMGGNAMDPAQNNAPLQFNTNKGKPPMPVAGKSPPLIGNADGSRDNRAGDLPPGGPGPNTMDNNQGMMNPAMGMMGQWPPMMGPMMGDPSMMMGPMGYGPMGFMGPMGPMGPSMEQRPKEVITLEHMTLYPPPPNAPPQSTRERPPGCRTVFVGGLPANATEELVKEIFGECGGPQGICSIRMSSKNFCHIRFPAEECVDKALFFSGYRVKLENKDDAPNTGRLHVDFAQARDDLYEWECKQRALAREHRHRQRLEEERLRPPSPPPVIHFSDHEASVLQEKLKDDDSFMKATQVLITWLERGDCNRRTANVFYSMVQSVNSHIRRLMNEKQLHDDELEAIKQQFRDRLEGVLRQFEQIEKVFGAAGKQKAWDHFSKAQRKNLDLWRRQCQETKSSQEEDFLKERQEAEMEMSDAEEAEDAPTTAKRAKMYADASQLNAVKDENEYLKSQLEAYKNEVEILKAENINQDDNKDKQLKALQQALQGMQRQLIDAKKEIRESEEACKVLRQKMLKENNVAKAVGEDSDKESVSKEDESSTTVSSSAESLSEREARLIALISTFLHVHPFGASVDYIWSYLQQVGIKIRTSEIEDLMEKLPAVYRQDILGVGASIEKRWKFIGFN